MVKNLKLKNLYVFTDGWKVIYTPLPPSPSTTPNTTLNQYYHYCFTTSNSWIWRMAVHLSGQGNIITNKHLDLMVFDLSLKRLIRNFRKLPCERFIWKSGLGKLFQGNKRFRIFTISRILYEIFAMKVYLFISFPKLSTWLETRSRLNLQVL